MELAGLPGTGKTTLVRELVRTGAGRIERLRPRHWRSIPRAVRNTVPLVVPFADLWLRRSDRAWKRFGLMVQLQTLADLTAAERRRSPAHVLLDQGAVYRLSILRRSLAAPNQAPYAPRAFERYWERTVAAWRRVLDLVVVLDADDDVIRRRILDRSSPHPVTSMTQKAAQHYFRASRDNLERTLTALRSQDRGPCILRVRTDQVAIQDALAVIRVRIEGSRSHGSVRRRATASDVE